MYILVTTIHIFIYTVEYWYIISVIILMIYLIIVNFCLSQYILHCTTLLVYTIIGMHYYDMYVIRSTYYCM